MKEFVENHFTDKNTKRYLVGIAFIVVLAFCAMFTMIASAQTR